tara:strand:- start:134 stop:457 length:324 start_codon:yes stop_codon:yes gene_type:complete
MLAGKKNKLMIKRFREKIPIADNICKLSNDHEKLYAQRFHGNPVSIKLLKKSKIENDKLIKTIEEIFKSIKYPTKAIGIEKNRDRKRGINTKANGIKNLKESSKVRE